MAGAVLTLVFYRKGQDLAASGFLVFAVGEGPRSAGGSQAPAGASIIPGPAGRGRVAQSCGRLAATTPYVEVRGG